MPVVLATGLLPSIRAARVVAVIPSRYSSSRLPGKPLALIDGMTMVEHVYRAASRAHTVDVVLVATDDQRIAQTVDEFGGTAVMTSERHATGTDRLAEVAAQLTGAIVVNVQGDEPMLTAEAIDASVTPLLTNPADHISTLRKRIDDASDLANPSVVKVVIDREGYALYFSRAAVPHVRAGQPAPISWRHLGLYAYRRELLLQLAQLPQTPLELAEGLEQLRMLEYGFRIRTVETTVETVGVDTPEDLERVRQLVGAAGS